jgi:hypothetical protein
VGVGYCAVTDVPPFWTSPIVFVPVSYSLNRVGNARLDDLLHQRHGPILTFHVSISIFQEGVHAAPSDELLGAIFEF